MRAGARVWSRARARALPTPCRACGRADERTGVRSVRRMDAPRTTHHVACHSLARSLSLSLALSLARARARVVRPPPSCHWSAAPRHLSRFRAPFYPVLGSVGESDDGRTGRSIVTCRRCQVKRDSYAHGRAARRAERKPEIRRRRPITALRLRGDSRDISHHPAPPRACRPLRFRASAPCERAHRRLSRKGFPDSPTFALTRLR